MKPSSLSWGTQANSSDAMINCFTDRSPLENGSLYITARRGIATPKSSLRTRAGALARDLQGLDGLELHDAFVAPEAQQRRGPQRPRGVERRRRGAAGQAVDALRGEVRREAILPDPGARGVHGGVHQAPRRARE